MPYTFAALTLAACIHLLGGCGQTGPLYLPSEPPPQPDAADTTGADADSEQAVTLP